MNELWYTIPWVLGCEAIGIAIGWIVGRKFADSVVQREHEKAMKMLADLLGTAEHIATGVDSHNSEIQANVDEVDRIQVSGKLDVVKQKLMKRLTAILDANQQLQEDLLCTRYRLQEQAVEIDRATREARTDELTGVNNCRAFHEKLHLLLDAWRRRQESFVLILADLDQFKWINDSHGHAAGDRCLRAVGAQINKLMREGDFAGRYGGDEFAILLPQTELAEGRAIAEKICQGISGETCRIAVRGGEVSLTASLGVAAPRHGDTDETIFDRADQVMYHSKHAGRAQVTAEETPAQPLPCVTAEPILGNPVESHA